jgi:hypothetical protein
MAVAFTGSRDRGSVMESPQWLVLVGFVSHFRFICDTMDPEVHGDMRMQADRIFGGGSLSTICEKETYWYDTNSFLIHGLSPYSHEPYRECEMISLDF